MTNEKFIMRDESNNYAYQIAVYGSDLYKAKIFEGNSEEYKKYGNEIILLNSKKGLELLAKEMEFLDRTIPQEEEKLEDMKNGRDRLYDSSPNVQEYIKIHNQKINPIIGISEETKQEIIERIYLRNKKREPMGGEVD